MSSDALDTPRAIPAQPPWRAWVLSIGVLLLALLAALPLQAAETVRVGLYENKPKVGIDDAGAPEGIFVDLIEAIAREEGWTLQYVRGTFGEGLARLAAGEIDLMPDVALTSERSGVYAFHQDAVLLSWSQVYARRGLGIRSLLDLHGKRVAVLEGSVQQDFIRQMMAGFNVDVVLLAQPDFDAAFRAVAEGRADAVITNRFYGARHAPASNLEDTAIVFSPSRLYFAGRRGGDAALLEAIDRRMQTFRGDPDSVYHRSIQRWVAGAAPPVLPPWVKWALPLGGLLLVLTAGWSLLQRRTLARLRESERRQRELAESLAHARDAAQAADRVKSAFLATMSHELRTPLNAIMGFTGIVLRGLAGPLNAEQTRQLSMVRDSSQQLLAMINEVLDISRIEAGQVVLDHQPVDLPALLQKAVGQVQPPAALKGLTVQVQADPALAAMAGDARRLEQLLLILLRNAVKFTETGGVTVDAQRLPGWRGPAGAGTPGDAVRVAVSDTGIGIRPEHLALLFQPFRQVDSALSRTHGGTGLGLAIAQRLAALMGGVIEVESVWQRGSTFTVTLPLQRPD